MEKFILKLLDAKEKKYNLQNELIEKYKKPLLSFQLNIPGIEKRNETLLAFHKKNSEYIENLLSEKIIYSQYVDEETGMYLLLIVDMNAIELKRKMISVEDSKKGRLFDIDIFDENKKQISRNSLGLNPRKCLLCEKDAKICMREKNHSSLELINEVNKILNES